MNRILKAFFIALIVIAGTSTSQAQVYYWVGGTGNWMETADVMIPEDTVIDYNQNPFDTTIIAAHLEPRYVHWSDTSGGPGLIAAYPPSSNNLVVFDENSFTALGQTVTIDTSFVSIAAMRWDLDSNHVLGGIASSYYNPSLVSLQATDTMIIGGTLRLHSTMSSWGYMGSMTFTGGYNDSIVSAGKPHLNDIIINTYDDTLTIKDDLTTAGDIIYKRGGLFADNRTLTANAFDSHQAGFRSFHADGTTFNLTGADTVLYIKEMDTLFGTNRIVNVNNTLTSNTIQIGLGGTVEDWGTLNLNNANTKFFGDSYFSSIPNSASIERIEIGDKDTLECDNFAVNGYCGKLIELFGDEGPYGGGNLDVPAALNLDFFHLKNISVNVASNATNTFDLGGNTNWTVNEDGSGDTTFYWIGGTGNFYDTVHWSYTSGGSIAGCLPSPNDTAIFNAVSFTANDTLYLNERVRIATIDFSDIDEVTVVAGTADTLEVRQDLIGDGNLQMDWGNPILINSNNAFALETGTGVYGLWNNDFWKTGTGMLTFSDAFNNSKDFHHIRGGMDTDSKNVSLSSYYCNVNTPTRFIDISNSKFTVNGSNYLVDSVNVGDGYYFGGSTIEFVSGGTTNFQPGNDSLETVSVQSNTTLNVLTKKLTYNTLLDIGPASTIVFNNLSNHIFNNLYAVGTCDSLVTMRSANTTWGAATLKGILPLTPTLNVDYAVIDNVKSGGGSLYFANSSQITDSSLVWITAGATLTTSVGFTIIAPNDTLAPGESASIASNGNLVIPANAVVVSSILTLGGVDTTGNTPTDKCDVELTGASTYATTALLPGDVPTANLNTITLPGVNGIVTLNLDQNNGAQTGDFVVDTAYLTVQYYLPYVSSVDTFYWYGDAGDWSDLNHWSENSGNIPAAAATCLPSTGDHVVFDDLSFSADGFTVNVDGDAYFGSMTWQAADDSATLVMDANLTASADVTWNEQLHILEGSAPGKFLFQPRNSEAELDANSALVEVDIDIISTNLNDTLSLVDSLVLGDLNAIVHYGGVVNTNNNYVYANSYSITSAFTPTELNLGTSEINLVSGYADYGGTSSTLNAGTSTMRIEAGDISNSNYFRGNDQTYYDVIWNFNTNNYSSITGSNTFDSLTVGAGSMLSVDTFSNNTVNNKFEMLGTCIDSIFIKSSLAATQFDFTSGAPLDAMCLSVQDADANVVGAGSFTTYFSNDIVNNTGSWSFDLAQSTTAYLDTMMNFCYGDTVVFADTSVAFQNDNVNLTSIWSFGDGETFTGDTTMHYYGFPGTYEFELVSMYSNFCTDTVIDTIQIFAPSVSLYSSIGDTVMCDEQLVSFYASSASPDSIATLYEFEINGVPTSVPTLDYDTLNTQGLTNPSFINVNIYENGCVVSSDTIEMDVLPVPTVGLSVPSSTICEGDTVTFTGSGAVEYQYYLNGVAITPYTTLPYVIDTINTGDSYYVIGRDTNTVVCGDTSNTITFTVNTLPVVTSFTDTDLDNIICEGDTVWFTGASATASNYLFYLNDTLISNSATSTIDIDTLVNGDQVYFVAQDAQSCYSTPTSPFTYLVNTIPDVTLLASEPLTICDGTTVIFQADSASQYQFFVNGLPIGPQSTSQFYATDTLNNNDIVTVEGDLFGCIGAPTGLTFTVTDLPITTLVSDLGDTICQGDQINMTANSATATNYEFLLNGVSQVSGPSNNYLFTTLTNGDLITVIGSANGCSDSDIMPITVFNNPNPSLFASNTSSCEFDPVVFTGTGSNEYEYYVNGDSVWYGAGAYTTDSLPVGLNDITVLGVNTTTGCSTLTSAVSVDVIELPTTNLTSVTNTICEGEPIEFTATSSVATEYQFYINGSQTGLPDANNTFTPVVINDGDYVHVLGWNNGCSNPGLDTVFVTVNPNPVATIGGGSSIFCEGSPEIFNGTSSIGGSTFEFIIDGSSEPLGASYDASGLLDGTHSIQLVVSSPGGCNDTTETNITVLPNPVVSFTGNNTICSGELTTFVASGASTYEFFVDGVSASTNSIFTTNALGNGNVVSLIGTSSAGCVSTNSSQVTMIVSPTPIVTLVSDDLDNILCSGENVTFTANGATNYEFFINGFSQGAPSATNTFSTTSLTNGQTVTVEGEDGGCIDGTTAGITFSVSNSPVVNLFNDADTVLCVDSLTMLIATGADDYLFYVNGAPQGVFSPMDTLNTLLTNGDIVTVEGMTNTCVTLASEAFEFSVFNYPATVMTSSDLDNIICYGEEVTFTGSGAMEYEYFVDGLSLGIGSSVLITDQIQDGETISLVGYNAECPTLVPPALTFVVNTLDLATSLTPSNFMICAGDALTVDATGADEYEIFVNNVSQGAQSTNSSFVLNNLNDGDYITLNGYSTTTGCTQSDDQTIYVQVFEAPAITVDASNTICEGDSTILTSNSLYGNQWYLDGTPILGATDTSYVVYVSGDYSLEIMNGGLGEIWSVGYNANGEFGDNSNFNSSLPSQADVVTDIVKVSSGINHTFSLESNGDLYVNGDNSSGQLGNGTFTASTMPIPVGAIPAITDMAAGENSSIVATTTGEVFTWGGNNDGQLGLGNTVVYNTPQWVVGVSGITNVAAGRTHFLALKDDGTVWSVGNNDFGQLGSGNLNSQDVFAQIPGLANIVSISAGDYHSIAIDNTGALFVWGDNSLGQLGTNDLNNRIVPELSALDNVSDAAGGNGHSVFVTNDQKAYATGSNIFGQLGTGDFIDRDSPTYLADIDAVVSVASGGYHSLFHKNDGTVWGAGRNDNYQLGDLAPAAIEFIDQVPGVEGVTYIDGGNECSHFIYGNSAICNSTTETIDVLSAPQPVLTYSGGILSTTAVGVSFEWFINNIPMVNSDVSSITPSEGGEYTVAVTYANGCISVSDPFIYSGVGIEDVELLNSISLYPNPTDGEFTLTWDAGLEVESIVLTDLLGKQIADVDLIGGLSSYAFDLSTFSKGVYNARVKTLGGSSVTLRIVKN